MASTEHEHADKVTQYRLEMIEKTLQAISENLSKLAALEQKHIETRDAVGRAFDAIEGHETRLRAVEVEMPTLKLTRKWVLSGVIGIVSLLAVAIFKLFTITVH
jgi:hypothetical protein